MGSAPAMRTMRGDRLHIGFFGRRNAGKSTLLNAITGHSVAIVSHIPGTTTDPVFKSMELAPVGPVVLIDTAGLDDSGLLGEERIKRTQSILHKTDLALLVVDGSASGFEFEDALLTSFHIENIPYIIILNKIDLPIHSAALEWLKSREYISTGFGNDSGILKLKQKIVELAPKEWEPPFLSDLIHPGEIVLLVVPIDLGAPKGRLIMPQVKALRDILDADAIPVMCKERELLTTLRSLSRKPALVITDSQVFPQVDADVPSDILLTSFSILSARQKGNLNQLVDAVLTVKSLKPGDRVLIAEACTHHPQEDDIGRVKIPRWLNQYVGGGLQIQTVQGSDFPEDLSQYRLVVHCGACTLNRKEMLNRQAISTEQNVPITNYGVLISFLKGVFPRALKPFPHIYALFNEKDPVTDFRLKGRMATMAEL